MHFTLLFARGKNGMGMGPPHCGPIALMQVQTGIDTRADEIWQVPAFPPALRRSDKWIVCGRKAGDWTYGPMQGSGGFWFLWIFITTNCKACCCYEYRRSYSENCLVNIIVCIVQVNFFHQMETLSFETRKLNLKAFLKRELYLQVKKLCAILCAIVGGKKGQV